MGGGEKTAQKNKTPPDSGGIGRDTPSPLKSLAHLLIAGLAKLTHSRSRKKFKLVGIALKHEARMHNAYYNRRAPSCCRAPQEFQIVPILTLRLRRWCRSACVRRLVEIGSGCVAGLINLDRTLKVRAVFDHDAGGG
jgi:hypothetical protein